MSDPATQEWVTEDVQVKPMVSYPLALTVQYEPAAAGAGSPAGFAVISLGDFVIHKEPLDLRAGEIVDRIDLEEAAATWLERVTREAAAR